jgi:dipeptidase D
MKTVRDTYQSLFNKVPEIMVIHAGLECGLFKNAYPNWDMVSFGPTIKFPHSPDEKVNVEAVGLYWQLLVEVLKNIPAKA